MEEEISSGQYDNMKLQYEIQQYDERLQAKINFIQTFYIIFFLETIKFVKR